MVYALELVGDLDALRAVRHTLAAGNTVVCLTECWNRLVIIAQIFLAELLVVFLFPALGVFLLSDALVVVCEDFRNVDSVRARHTVVAVRTVDHREL